MVHLLFLLLASQPLAALPDDPPVRIWLGSSSSLTSGDPGRVYVRTTTEGHLVLLHARTDGRVEVLFPADPMRDPFVSAGTYEIPFASSGPEGPGMVVAALSPDPIWFDEFVHRSMWDVAALSGAGAGADPEAALTDVVQRMLGDGSFSYDLVTYYVVPAPPPVTAVSAPVVEYANGCVDCYYPGMGYVIYGSVPFYPYSPYGYSPYYSNRRRIGGADHRARTVLPDPPAMAAYAVQRPNPLAPLPMRPREIARPPRLVVASAPAWRRRIPVAAAVPTASTARAVPLVARTRSPAARPTAAARSQLAVRYIRPPRNPSAALAPVNTPATAALAAVPARGFTRAAASPAIGVRAAPVPAPVRPMPAAPRFAARARVWSGVSGTGVATAGPAAASAGASAGVGLQAVGTAGWRR